jgi:hypothetical protein
MDRTSLVLRSSVLAAVLCACSSSATDTGSPAEDARAVDCQGLCILEASYTISTDGFFASHLDRALLSPPQGFRHEAGSSENLACSPALPACTPGAPVSMCDISQDLRDADVTKALAEPERPFFNEDERSVDGEAFSFMRTDGHGFELSNRPCQSKGCRPSPPGIQRLANDLLLLDGAVIETPECQALKVPLTVAGRTRF